MAHPKYNTPEYRATKAQADHAQTLGHTLTCVEPICLYPTRDIHPTQGNDIAHDPTGTRILGPAHPKCNRSEGGKRGNAKRKNPKRMRIF